MAQGNAEPDGDITGIDHLMLAVKDGAAAAAHFARMGFTITPRGQLPGMSNRLLCFANAGENVPNFVELMSLDDPAKAPPSMAQALQGAERPVLIVAASADAKATRERLTGKGVATSEVIDGQRDWTLDDGSVIDLAFSIVLPAGGQAPFYWIACQHRTPQHYLRADFTTHANGATELSKIIALAQDPAAAARHYGDMWAGAIDDTTPQGGPVIIKRGRVALHIHSPESLAATYPGVTPQQDNDHIVGFGVVVASPEDMHHNLTANGFEPKIAGENVVLDPSQAHGCLVVFETPGP
jgi:glyoxalase-like protein